MENATVTVTRAHSRLKLETSTSHDGAFTLSVPPGTYELEAGFGKAVCGESWPRTVRVSPGAA